MNISAHDIFSGLIKCLNHNKDSLPSDVIEYLKTTLSDNWVDCGEIKLNQQCSGINSVIQSAWYRLNETEKMTSSQLLMQTGSENSLEKYGMDAGSTEFFIDGEKVNDRIYWFNSLNHDVLCENAGLVWAGKFKAVCNKTGKAIEFNAA